MTTIEKLKEEYLTEEQIADFMGIGVPELRNKKSAKTGPPPTKMGRKTVYHAEKFRRWLASRETKTA